jgi:hypothetical protein
MEESFKELDSFELQVEPVTVEFIDGEQTENASPNAEYVLNSLKILF